MQSIPAFGPSFCVSAPTRPAMPLQRGLLVLAGWSVLAAFAGLSASADNLMPPDTASSYGLVQVYQHSLSVALGVDSVVDQKLHVSRTETRQYVELVQVDGDVTTSGGDEAAATDDGEATDDAGKASGKVVARFATDQTSFSNHLTGVEEATRQAKNQQRRLRRFGIETELRTVDVPLVRLITLTDRGQLEVLDAESGQTLWREDVGDPGRQYYSIGCSDKYVAVVNGSQLFVLSIENGALVKQAELERPPLFGPAIAGELAIVPGLLGSIEGVYVTDVKRDDFVLMASGPPAAPMTGAIETDKIAIPTETGFVFVVHTDGRPGADFRLATSGKVVAPLAVGTGERFFFATTAGQVYGMQATKNGRVLWTVPLGEPVTEQVLLDGDRVFVCTAYGNVFALDASSGELLWDAPAPGAREILGVTAGHVYALRNAGGTSVIDANNGKVVRNLYGLQPAGSVQNSLTDRLYLVSRRGTLQCLRPEISELPELKQMPPVETKPEESETAESESESETAEAPVTGNPFGGTGDDDPFGGMGEDPFGDTGDDNPFGGFDDDNPF